MDSYFELQSSFTTKKTYLYSNFPWAETSAFSSLARFIKNNLIPSACNTTQIYANIQVDEQIDINFTDRQIDRKIDRKIDRQINRQMDSQIDNQLDI